MTCKLRLAIMALFMASSAFAKIWTVNNNAGINADFTSLDAAANSQNVAFGDTIYIIGSPTSYGGDIFLSKTLHIFGPGYFLFENPETQANQNTAKVAGLRFLQGSEGSFVTGVEFTNQVIITANNITFKRNLFIKTDTNPLITISGSNVILIQSYLSGIPTGGSGVINVSVASTNIIIRNNFIENRNQANLALTSPTGASIDVRNNVFHGRIEINNAVFLNNILRSGAFSGQGNDVRFNIGNAVQFGSTNGNQQNVNMAEVFLNTGSTDGRWQLKDGSPAKGTGLDGADIGMFGGASSYVLSGIPSLPAIYFLNSPAEGSQSGGLPVHIKIKANN